MAFPLKSLSSPEMTAAATVGRGVERVSCPKVVTHLGRLSRKCYRTDKQIFEAFIGAQWSDKGLSKRLCAGCGDFAGGFFSLFWTELMVDTSGAFFLHSVINLSGIFM